MLPFWNDDFIRPRRILLKGDGTHTKTYSIINGYSITSNIFQNQNINIKDGLCAVGV